MKQNSSQDTGNDIKEAPRTRRYACGTTRLREVAIWQLSCDCPVLHVNYGVHPGTVSMYA